MHRMQQQPPAITYCVVLVMPVAAGVSGALGDDAAPGAAATVEFGDVDGAEAVLAVAGSLFG